MALLKQLVYKYYSTARLAFQFVNNFLNFIKILNNKNNIIDNNNLNYYINYISDQIEFNIIGHLNSPYKYGINTKLINIFNKYNCNNHKLQCEFITIMTDLVQD